MRLSYTHEARLELADAASYYESCRKGLGREFYQRIIAAEEDITITRKHGAVWVIRTGANC